MKFALPTYALERPVTVSMIVVAVLTLGAVVWPRIPREFMIDMDFPVLRCVIPYPGATPEQVERDIAIPAEGQFRTVPGLRRIRTHASTSGCHIEILFDWGHDMSLALSDVRDRVERLRADLPDGVDRIFVTRSGSDTQSMLSFTIFSDSDDRDLAQWVHHQLKSRLSRLPGVAQIDIWGADTGTVYIEFNPDALRAANLSLYQVIARLRESNVDLAAGRLHDGNTVQAVRVVSDVDDLDELRDTVISSNALRLKHVAAVSWSGPLVGFRHTIDGRKGVFVRVLKNSGANTIDTCALVNAELDLLRQEPIAQGMDVFIFEDQSRDMLNAIDMLTVAGLNGGLLALLILFAFVRRVRATLVVAVSVPISTVIGLIAMYFTGMSLNAVTLASMIICLGMLVDNSIVVMENILRYRERGYGTYESARLGANEVSLAITTATLTTVVVFFPVFYIDTGELAIYMQEFALPVTVALVASLVVSLTVVPLVLGRLTSRAEERSLQGRLLPEAARIPAGASAFRQVWDRAANALRFPSLATWYGAALHGVLRWRLPSILALAGIMVATIAIPFARVGTRTLPRMDARMVEVNVSFDQTYDWPMAETVFDAVEQVLDRQRIDLGIRNVYVSAGASGGRVRAYLVEPGQDLGSTSRRYSTDDVGRILQAQLPRLIPGGELRVDVVEADTGGGSTVTLRMRGEDVTQLKQYAARFAQLAADIPEVNEVILDTERETEEIQLLVDDIMAAQAGVSPILIAQTVDFALRGTRVFDLRREGTEVPVMAGFGEDDRRTVGDLERMAVPGESGELIPLAELVRRVKADTPQSIQRVDGRNVVTIIARVDTPELSRVKVELDNLVAAFHLPPGYDIAEGERLAQLEVNAENYAVALALAIVLIYVVMGALFESYLLPLSILTSVPLAFIGVYWAMYLAGTPVDVISMIGGILMCGIVVNNGIVLVDHINRKRTDDRSIAAIVSACRDRFRPVMMTSLTTILACIPLAVGSHVADVGLSSVGWTLIGGLTTGTLLTLFIVPLFYTLVEELREWFLRYFASVAALVTRPTSK
jgi:HAE1 family hydrophobic/amphiphilic exporter-1